MNQPIPEFITITDKGIILPKQEVKLVKSDDPILKEKMPMFDFGNDNAESVGGILAEILTKTKGIGLSANQIGLRKRCFVMGVGEDIVGYFNPYILEHSQEEELKEEGCLSFPNFFVKILRPKSIRVSYQDYTGHAHEKFFDGMTARCFQHEMDHLNGLTIHDRAGPMALQIAKKKYKKRIMKQ